MSGVLNQILDNCASVSGAFLKKGANSIEFLLDSPDGTSRAVIYTLLPGMALTYFNINALALPDSEENIGLKRLQFNYCVRGRVELLLDDDTYIYLKKNDFCISRQASKNESFFPIKHYQGIALSFDIDLLSNLGRPILETFDLDFSHLQEIYCDKRGTYIAEANEKIKIILGKIWSLFENPSLFYMRLYVIELLHLLLEKEMCQAKTCAFYTNIQVEIAKKAEEILTADLRKHIPIRLLAEQFSVSETSLKNYFRGVYGQNISAYLRKLRMNTAAKLLAETKIPISEVSIQIGYTKQGRFAAVFKQQFNMAPLEYRRAKRLEKL
ncbi:MAG TPA: AraC family transcriptional regulator [Arachidicoccus sp.]